MKSKIPSDWHNCATCSNWCGSATSDFFRKWVEFDRNEKGLCVGGFRGCEMQPMGARQGEAPCRNRALAAQDHLKSGKTC